METTTYKQNVDIKLARMTRFRNNFHQVLSILKPWKAKQFVYNCGSNKPKSLNRIAKISYGHSSPRKEDTIFEEEKKTTHSTNVSCFNDMFRNQGSTNPFNSYYHSAQIFKKPF